MLYPHFEIFNYPYFIDIDCDNGPHARNNGIYVSMYHLPRICHTLVPKIHVRPEMLRVFRYIDMLTCVIYSLTEQYSNSNSLVPRSHLYRRRQVGECADTWYKQIETLLRH